MSAQPSAAAVAGIPQRDVVLDDVTIRFGDFTAVDRVSLRIEDGEFFTILGPSGCGKTTILRAVSGFLDPSAGRVLIGGRDMRGIGPNKRPTALIFQNLALFPLMKVWENIAFGLEVRGVPKAARRRRADELLELIALPDQGDKLVSELSGGQRQRVAIARALAVEPSVLLLDEPLSALDLKLRQHMRSELRAIQKRTGVTFIYITHDQGEALTMSDRVGVMSEGVLQQVGTPDAVYDAPATAFVAGFVGEANHFAGTVTEVADGIAAIDTPFGRLRGACRQPLSPGDRAVLFVRPESLEPVADGEAPDGRVTLTSRVRHRDFEGAFIHLFLDRASGPPLALHLTNSGEANAWSDGTPITVGYWPERAHMLPAAKDSRHG